MKNYEKYETPREKVSTFLKEAEASFLAESSKQTLLLFAEWLEEDPKPKAPKLKSCPCCGKKAVKLEYYGGKYHIYCTECFIQTGYHETEEEAILTWNTRHSATPSPE